jgi:hypothetical protein
MGARRMRKRSHHRPDDRPPEAAAATEPAVFGDGPDGACGVEAAPFPAGAGVALCLRAAATAGVVRTGGAAVWPSVEALVVAFADWRPNACSAATTVARFAAGVGAVDAEAEEDGAWAAADGDTGVDDVPSRLVVTGAAAAVGAVLMSPMLTRPGADVVGAAATVEAGSAAVGAGGVAEAAGGGESVP